MTFAPRAALLAAGAAFLALGGFAAVRPEAAGEFLWEALRLPAPAVALSESAPLALEIGNHYFGGSPNAYDPARAESYFLKALKLDPLVPDAWHQLARIAFLRGDFDEALARVNRQIELHGEDLMASFYVRGLVAGYRGDLAAAERDFKEFLSWDPDNWAAANDLAWVFFKGGRFAAAEAAADAALRKSPGNPWLLLMRGVSRGELGRRSEALRDILAAREAAAALTPAHWSRAYPGNDPRQAESGLAALRAVIEENIALFSPEGGA